MIYEERSLIQKVIWNQWKLVQTLSTCFNLFQEEVDRQPESFKMSPLLTCIPLIPKYKALTKKYILHPIQCMYFHNKSKECKDVITTHTTLNQRPLFKLSFGESLVECCFHARIHHYLTIRIITFAQYSNVLCHAIKKEDSN